jgi:hypothetical protein
MSSRDVRIVGPRPKWITSTDKRICRVSCKKRYTCVTRHQRMGEQSRLSTWPDVSVLSSTHSCEQRVASNSTWPWNSWERSRQRKLQFATRAVQNRAAACVAAGDGICEKLLKTQICVNWRKFREVQLNLYLIYTSKFVMYYARLLFCSVYFR